MFVCTASALDASHWRKHLLRRYLVLGGRVIYIGALTHELIERPDEVDRNHIISAATVECVHAARHGFATRRVELRDPTCLQATQTFSGRKYHFWSGCTALYHRPRPSSSESPAQ